MSTSDEKLWTALMTHADRDDFTLHRPSGRVGFANSPSPQPLVGNKTRPNKQKRRSWRGEARDSLAFRERLGKPGSRRYQRWVNDFFVLELNRSLSDLEDEIEWIDDDDWYFNTTPEPPLRRLLGDEASFKAFESLLSVTEEEQARTLEQMDKSVQREWNPKPSRARVGSLSPDEAFGQLSKPMRRFLKQYCNTEMCQEVDRHLRQLLASDEPSSQFLWRHPFQRKLAHALSRYYCMTSYSTDGREGRVTVVVKTGQSVFPVVAVSDYLLVE